ncbi:ABC transporter substrate-binding protein [Thalassospira sp. TSL5-1]|uniref:ABC transporter substrate-binding protein n=1 Tax=Thalassospira sp. TSL5-1 TaxID=1544451 RepID=UPI00093B58C7|nr:ABC transporter substrate-binding protein [Thalassospira sp. TSL5-1]OKH89582.1 ABC transporter substrate-binding protein [Thalassospira sp. TSL5-1]
MRKLIAGLIMGTALATTPVFAVAQTPKDTLVMANAIDDIISLDPAEMFEFSATEYNGNTYDRLVELDIKDSSKLVGGAAESWTISDDGMTYTFKMRPGIKFASGNSMTAHDAAFSLQRVILLDKSPAFILGQFGFNAENVKEKIRATDDETLVVEVNKPFAPSFFLNCLTSMIGAVVDQKEVLAHEENGDLGNGWLSSHYAGSGPFILKNWTAGQSLSLVANENYWDGAPAMKRVIIRNVKEAASQQLLLEKGDIDIARNLEADQIASIKDNPDIKIMKRGKGAVWYLGLSQKNKYLSNPKVIEALKYLVDYKGISDTIMAGRATVHQTFLPDGFLGASNETPYSLNVEKANALLDEAGFADGFTVTIDTRNTTAVMAMAQSIQSTWAQAGINLEIIPGDNKQTLTKYRARQHDIYIGRWGADYQDPHSNASTFAWNPDNSDDASAKPLAWRNSWNPGDMTQEVDAAVLERDAAKRAAMYQDLQDKVLKTGPFIIMFQETEVSSLRANVNNFILGPSFDTNFYRFVTKD